MAQSQTIGDPLDPATQIGPLVNEAQLRKVESYIQRGIDDGGTVTTGGKRRATSLSRPFSKGWTTPAWWPVTRSSALC
jgi:acyl-CoA reductase-like NAD-dependent aldehyde dehydrogenase